MGSSCKSRLKQYEEEIRQSFKSDTLDLVKHVSSLEKFKSSISNAEQIAGKEQPIIVTEEFMSSSKKHKPRIL